MERLLILDSNSIINRAYYGVRTLNAADGTPTNAIYGFLNILLKLISDYEPQYIFAAFDLKAPTFRHKMYKEYKANRTGMPDELAAQLPIMKDILTEMNIPILQLEGYEADDIIGTVSRICGEKNIECYIATGDRDDLQLTGGGTTVILASTKQGQSVTELYDEAAVKSRYSVSPEEFTELKALMGDQSDNIPGVSGIGEKTAIKLISQYSSLDNIYAHIDELPVSARIKNNLTAEKDIAYLSLELARIDKNVPIEPDFAKGAYNAKEPSFKSGLHAILLRLGLKSIIKKLDIKPGADTPLPENSDFMNGKKIIPIEDKDEFRSSVLSLGENISVYLKLRDNEPVCAAFSDGKLSYFSSGALTATALAEAIAPILSDGNINKYICGLKEAYTAFCGITELNGFIFDCTIAAYLDDPSRQHDIDTLAAAYLGVYPDQRESQQLSLFDDDIPDDAAGRYALIVFALYEKLSEKIEENGQHELYYDVELPLVRVIASMQELGFTLDTEELRRFGAMLQTRLEDAEEKIYSAAGQEFNINSPKQLGTVLFEKLKIPGGKKTKSGYSTKADVLEKLSAKYPIVRDVLEYRSYQKLKSTYCDSLAELVNPKTNRIHSIFNQMGTVTGRLSSAEPNMQNIPTRTELGRELRKMFSAKDGCVLVDADYSQIELRVLAHLSQDEAMIEAFRSGADIHAVTASKILGIPIDKLTKEQRASAKAVNFGIVYGMGEYTLSQDLGISFREAKKYMDEYFSKYHGVREYMDNLKKYAHEHGYVKTLMNRIRYIPELNASNAAMRSYGERAAMNTPVQGTAADIIKLAMVRVYDRLKREQLSARLILQVHDELIVEAPIDEVDKVKEILRTEMENAIKLDVPLIVDMSSGKSWYDAK